MSSRSTLAIAAIMAFVAGYILGGAIIYQEAPSTSHAYKELSGQQGAVEPPAYEGLVGSARNATIEGHVVLEGRPEPVSLGPHMLPMIDGVLVVPEPGLWKVKTTEGREEMVCHMEVAKRILSADKARIEGEAASWYLEGHGWERVVVAEHVTLWKAGVVEQLDHEEDHCMPMHGPMHEWDEEEWDHDS